jgi:hypothetical protein
MNRENLRSAHDQCRSKEDNRAEQTIIQEVLEQGKDVLHEGGHTKMLKIV